MPGLRAFDGWAGLSARLAGRHLVRQPGVAAGAALLDRATADAGIGAWECDLSDQALSWTSGVFDLFGLPRGSRIDRRDIVEMYSDDSREAMEWLRADAIARGRGFTLDAQICRPDGQRRWMRLTTAVQSQGGRARRIYGLKRDITESRAEWDKLRRAVDHDPETGLASRSCFERRFLDRPATGVELWPLGALVLIAVDGVGRVFDGPGAAAGAACLDALANRLVAGFPDALLIARVDDEHFAVLTHAHRASGDFEAQVAGALAQLAAPIYWSGRALALRPRAAIAAAENGFAYEAPAMLADAERALARAGQNGLAAVQVAPGRPVWPVATPPARRRG